MEWCKQLILMTLIAIRQLMTLSYQYINININININNINNIKTKIHGAVIGGYWRKARPIKN